MDIVLSEYPDKSHDFRNFIFMTSHFSTLLTRWMFTSNRDYRTYLSPLQLKVTVELVAVSQLSSYQPAKLFLLFVHGSKPLSKNTRVWLWDTPRRRTFLKILDNPDRLQATEVSKRIAINRSSLSLEKLKCPEIHIDDKKIFKIKLF